jgi:hypothetical protein
MTRTTLVRCPAARQLIVNALSALALAASFTANAGKVLDIKLSGSPATSVKAGQAYSFTPTVTGAQTKVRFWIAHLPFWAEFSNSTGTLSGTACKGCAGATFSDIVIYANDYSGTTSYAPFSITVLADGSTAVTISGTPSSSVTAGSAYSFDPSATAPAGSALSFSIQNKPSWSTLSIATGALTGTPSSSQTGTYSGIVISASDGTASASLPAFSITVNAASKTSSTGSATLSWTAPTTNTNGSPLTDLSGYTVYYGTSASSLTQTVQLTDPTDVSYTIQNLAAGTWYFGVTALASDGTQSSMSNVASKTID